MGEKRKKRKIRVSVVTYRDILHVFLIQFIFILQQREKSWFASSVKSRLQYLGPIPGFPCISEHPNQEIALDPSTGPVGAFCLLVLDPDQV